MSESKIVGARFCTPWMHSPNITLLPPPTPGQVWLQAELETRNKGGECLAPLVIRVLP